MNADYRIEPLAKHDRSDFSCGDAALDHYFRKVIGQDVRRRAATAFVAVDAKDAVSGFYTLSAADLDRRELPVALAVKAPPYARIPTILLGRLAVAVHAQGQGLGRTLLADAFSRAVKSEIGAHLMMVEPKNDDARAFYGAWGFLALTAPSKLMFLPIATAARLLN